MDTVHNKAILSLSYKLIDKYENLILFGGIVRDYIIPSIDKGINPFTELSEKDLSEKIDDVDIYFSGENYIDETDFLEWFFGDLNYKLGEWDWISEDPVKYRDMYSTEGYKVNLTHSLCGVKTHIDFVKLNTINQDADVNVFTFGKLRGIDIIPTNIKDRSINSFFTGAKIFKDVTQKINRKELNMFGGCLFDSERKENEKISLLLERFIKYIRKGWTILNIDNDIFIHKEKDHECNICYTAESDIYIKLACSNCFLCLFCFEKLLKSSITEEEKYYFSCPTCRKKMTPWKKIC